MTTAHKIWVLVGVAIVIFSAIFLSRRSAAPVSSTATTTPATSTVKTASIPIAPLIHEKFEHKDAHKSYTMDNTYPESSPTKYPEIYNFVENAKKSFLADYNDITDTQAINLQLADRPYNFSITTRIATSSKTVSYILEVYTFEGGAHGGTTVGTFTYDKNQKLVTLDRVFAKPWLPVIAPLARQYLYKTLGTDVQKQMIDSGTEPTLENFSAWYLTDNTITFIFQQYQVGPYVIGIQEFPIPKSQIKSILSPEFQ